MSWTLHDLVQATGGELVQAGEGPFTGVSTDSRRIAAGEVFVALAGPRFDAHDFLDEVAARGASGVIVSRPGTAPHAGLAWILVDDTLRALGDLAAFRRRTLSTKVIGVTGSNGKTTTKEMIAAVLAAAGGKVARTRGTENNLIGLPLTLLGLDGDEDYAVLEMGMNRSGEIARLTDIAQPDVGIITNVGPAHLEGLGSLANVAAAKAELPEHMAAAATLVVPAEDGWLAPVAGRFPGRTIKVGEGGEVRASSVEPNDEGQRVALEIAGRTFGAQLRCRGAHNVLNALLAAAVGLALGLDAGTVARGLETFTPPPMRLELIALASGARVLNDAYNANPASVSAALSSLAAEPAERRIAVLGEMLELGPEAPRYHREAGKAAANARVDRLIAVGPRAAEMAAGAKEAGMAGERVQTVDSAEDAGRLLARTLGSGDLVLIKGSRGARMEEVLHHLGRLV